MLRMFPGSEMPHVPPHPAPVSPDVQLVEFHQPGIFNYSALLLSEDKDTLYVGAREAVFAVNALDVSQKQHEVWPGLLWSGLQTFPVFSPQVITLGSSFLGRVACSPCDRPCGHPVSREQPPLLPAG